MFQRAELAHISRLHHIGRQLAVLKRMYQSYEQIIDRVLEKHEATIASLKNSHVIASGGDGGAESLNSSQVAESQSFLGVSLSSAARSRFERLKYRIRLYALSEIEECLSQKDNLVTMVTAIRVWYTIRKTDRSIIIAELQSHRHKAVHLRGAAHARDAAPRQSHHPLHACVAYERVLLVPVHGHGVQS